MSNETVASRSDGSVNGTETNVSPRAASARNVLAPDHPTIYSCGRYLWHVMNNPGRNDPCHCGSGKKYKKCCLPREQPTRTSNPRREESFIAELRPDLDEAVDRALQRLERGEGKQVESEIAQL